MCYANLNCVKVNIYVFHVFIYVHVFQSFPQLNTSKLTSIDSAITMCIEN